MDRRSFLSHTSRLGLGVVSGVALTGPAGCRGRQVAHVLDDEQGDLVGSHAAGAETYNRLVAESVARLLGRQGSSMHLSSASNAEWSAGKRICFIGVENRSAEELGDFKEQLYQEIDTAINQSGEFQVISRRFVEAGLRVAHLRPDDLFTPDGARAFTTAMEQQGQVFDYMLFATLTSGTTTSNSNQQRDYLLTLELVNTVTGEMDKESAKVRKGYHKSHLGKFNSYNPFTKKS